MYLNGKGYLLTLREISLESYLVRKRFAIQKATKNINLDPRKLFFIIFIHTKKRKYNADTSLQERRQEKDMIIWC
jgi:hypothetical protein